jgi:hypothetical protein
MAVVMAVRSMFVLIDCHARGKGNSLAERKAAEQPGEVRQNN